MGVILFKPGVRITPDPAGARLLGSLDRVARQGAVDLTVTCGSDSHPPSDPHSAGRALDIRTHGLSDGEKAFVLRALLLDLSDGVLDAPQELPIGGIWLALATRRWFGQIEAHGQPNEHLHVQLRRGAVFPPATERTLTA